MQNSRASQLQNIEQYILRFFALECSLEQNGIFYREYPMFFRLLRYSVRVLLLGMLSIYVLFLGGCGAAYYTFGRDLPSHREVVEYDPSTITRVYASDGALMAEFAKEKRLFVPIEAIPLHVRQAFLSAEDKDFYSHGGVDFLSLGSAMVRNVHRVLTGKRPAGASTITQQVAKNFITGGAMSLSRKVEEAFIAWRLEADLDKDRILELYVNEIYYGVHSYGMAQAALTYFDKGVGELTIAEGAYLAAVINGPSINHPVKHKKRATARRNWVIGEMLENNFITQKEHDEAIQTPLVAILKPRRSVIENAGFFAAEVRRELIKNFGEESVKSDGLNVRSTMQQDYQNLAKKALQEGLVKYDRRHGWRGPIARLDIQGLDWIDAINASDEAVYAANIVPEDWRIALVTKVSLSFATIGFADGRTGTIDMEEMRWAASPLEDKEVGPPPNRPSQVVAVGDVVAVMKAATGGEQAWALMQIPEIEGAIVAMDPHTGRVLALVGGFDFTKSNYNRATQAERQPGSTFKPFVYLAGINAGYSPTTEILDNPWIVKDPIRDEVWRPVNYDGRFLGAKPMHVGLEWSRNLMTVRLAQAVGMDSVVEIAKAFGVGKHTGKYLAAALGSDTVSLLDITTAYGILANGGRRIYPSLIDRVQDHDGNTIYKQDQRRCVACDAENYNSSLLPMVLQPAEQVADPFVIYQVTSMLRGVVERGTAQSVAVMMDGRPIAGKTGTTNEARDAWFIGYTPDLVVGVFVGFDTPTPLGDEEGGGKAAAPIFADFMAKVLAGTEKIPFRLPEGVPTQYVDPLTGTIDVRRMENDGRQIRGGTVSTLTPVIPSRQNSSADSGEEESAGRFADIESTNSPNIMGGADDNEDEVGLPNSGSSLGGVY